MAKCDLCGREFPVELLIAAHIKQRAQCSNLERQDEANVVMSACRLGCDELFERGYISVNDDGAVIASEAIQSSVHVVAYATQHLAGKVFGESMAGRRGYFAWHRDNKLITGQSDIAGTGPGVDFESGAGRRRPGKDGPSGI
jgi:predicted restriction endonuclease